MDHRRATTEIENLHPWTDRHDLDERLGQPERIWPHLIGCDPRGFVLVGAHVALMVQQLGLA